MDKEGLQKLWKKLLIDEEKTALECWQALNLNPVVWNRKLREGTIKYIEFVNILESLGYRVEIKKGE